MVARILTITAARFHRYLRLRKQEVSREGTCYWEEGEEPTLAFIFINRLWNSNTRLKNDTFSTRPPLSLDHFSIIRSIHNSFRHPLHYYRPNPPPLEAQTAQPFLKVKPDEKLHRQSSIPQKQALFQIVVSYTRKNPTLYKPTPDRRVV